MNRQLEKMLVGLHSDYAAMQRADAAEQAEKTGGTTFEAVFARAHYLNSF